MELKLNKKIKNLSKDSKVLPERMTPMVAGGLPIHTSPVICDIIVIDTLISVGC
jgi:hypothetical protein